MKVESLLHTGSGVDAILYEPRAVAYRQACAHRDNLTSALTGRSGQWWLSHCRKSTTRLLFLQGWDVTNKLSTYVTT
jgi:hypothetical protein